MSIPPSPLLSISSAPFVGRVLVSWNTKISLIRRRRRCRPTLRRKPFDDGALVGWRSFAAADVNRRRVARQDPEAGRQSVAEGRLADLDSDVAGNEGGPDVEDAKFGHQPEIAMRRAECEPALAQRNGSIGANVPELTVRGCSTTRPWASPSLIRARISASSGAAAGPR
jgi:hypothetical protein